ncbi:MAG: DUF4402 domain-containing protein [Candidatus Margulisbacteria bacterium]|nr:DUF4402 domain-containing protein [Candidatus Margulisiibacteriota bacterium]
MKKRSLWIALLGGILLFIPDVMGAQTSVQLQAVVVPSPTLRVKNKPRFGSFSVGSEGGTVSTSGETSGDVSYMGNAKPIKYVLKGEPKASIQVTFSETILNDGQSNTMKTSEESRGVVLNKKGKYKGKQALLLHVKGGQKEGAYSGHMNIIFNY